jgi:hypothetical protein
MALATAPKLIRLSGPTGGLTSACLGVFLTITWGE